MGFVSYYVPGLLNDEFSIGQPGIGQEKLKIHVWCDVNSMEMLFQIFKKISQFNKNTKNIKNGT